MALRSDELRARLIAETVTSNQIVEGAIKSTRNALTEKEKMAAMMIHVLRKSNREYEARIQAEEQAAKEAAEEATK
ncbi:hypothetical protein KAU45_02660 [bacterium]|nr:hypothetical protein [bacterium]